MNRLWAYAAALLLFSVTSFADDAVLAVNVNTASAEEIAEVLVGIGARKAEAIVAYREANGRFDRAEELQLVKGIGEFTVERNLERIRVHE